MKELKNYMIMVMVMVCWIMLLVGCSHLPISIQIVDDEQIIDQAKPLIEGIAVELIKEHDQDTIDKIVAYCDKALALPDDKEFEAYFNNGLQMLPDLLISNPIYRGFVKGLLSSYKINVDTGNIDFDLGSLRVAREEITILRGLLKG